MNHRRVWLLFKNELLHGPKDVILTMAVVLPVLLALFVNLAFGNIFTERPKLGIYDTGSSSISALLEQNSSLIVKTYSSEEALKAATERGSVDMGIILPSDFDAKARASQVDLKAYVWGESPAKSRYILPIALSNAVREINGAELPVHIESIALGEDTAQPWDQRLMPLTILIAVFFGGMMLPAASLIHEKNKHTLEALNVTPVSLTEIFSSKGLAGIVLAISMGILTMAISRAFNENWLYMLITLALGAVMAALLGLLAGALIKDLNTLFAFWKFGGLLLFGPAFIFMFPQIPQWLGYFFPTYYVIRPVVDISVNGAGFGDVWLYLLILIALLAVLVLVVNKVIRQLSTRALRLNG